MAVIQQGNAILFKLGKPASADTVKISHVPQMRRFVMGHVFFRLIRKKHLDNHFARSFCTRRIGCDHHPVRGFADAGGDQSTFAVHLDHTGTAVSIGPIPRRGFVT